MVKTLPAQRAQLAGGAPWIGKGAHRRPQETTFDLPESLDLDVGVGFFAKQAPRDWISVVDLPLVVLFGTTGVGKTTTLEVLDDLSCQWRRLPGRRLLTSRLIVEPQLRGEALKEADLARLDRYRFVRSFRERFAGGMSTLLSGLAVDRQLWPGTLVFDGLRGLAEAEHAVKQFPSARFLVLACPDFVRLKRLLARNDPHDRSVARDIESGVPSSFAEVAPKGLRGHFAPEEENELMQAMRNGHFSVEDVRTKLDILDQDLRTHDPSGTRNLLESKYGHRSLVVDTSRTSPEESGREILSWIGNSGRQVHGGGGPE